MTEEKAEEKVIEPEIVEEEPKATSEEESDIAQEEDSNVEELDAAKSEDVEEDFKAKFFYLAAEMENFKKRSERERDNLLKYGNEKVLSNLIEVVDNLDRTVDAIANDEDDKIKNIFIGIDMVRKQFLDVLKGSGLEKVEALGETFDPNFHEAMAQQPAEGKADQEVIQVFQPGYQLNGRLLRPAKVVIANNG
jgi:molecular chaperone GrpE